jgi:L-2-hydroxyglutarate oxidase LhgO
MNEVDAVVIGAGVVGLAVARSLASQGREVLILEAEGAFGTGTSSRNSEVIHAGLYYPKGSLKAKLCVEGNRLLYAYCQERGVEHKRVGKLLVAANEGELPLLAEVERKALGNGVGDLTRLSQADAVAMEPELACAAALLSPSTGIVDSHGLMLALLADGEALGATLALKSPVIGGRVGERGIDLLVGGAEPSTLRAGLVVNCAGLGAWTVSQLIMGVPDESIPPRHYCKGNYFLLTGKTPFRRLVYPVPGHAGLGVHLTLDLAGQARFGPDTEWINEIGYEVDERRGDSFYAAIRSYWPGLADGALRPGYAGVRPKIQGPADPARDFLIEGPADHGVPGWVALYGIESPGLTSSLAIASHVLGLGGL